MRFAIAQINSTVADFSGNKEKILSFAWKAKNEHSADLVLFPELALCGFPPLDLLQQNNFIDLNIKTLEMLKHELPDDLAVGLGYVNRSSNPRSKKPVNAYGFIRGRKLVFEQAKTLLPENGFFNEAQYFEAAVDRNVFKFKGQRIALAIDEEAFLRTDPVHDLIHMGITILCVPSASPYTIGGIKTRREKALQVNRHAIPLICINAVGANDSIIFAGQSFVAAPADPMLEAKAFEEDLLIWDWLSQGKETTVSKPAGIEAIEGDLVFEAGLTRSDLDELEQALVLGIRDYMKKCGFNRLHLGLSGGLDSALVACLAVNAAGPRNTVCFNMPSRFSSQGSKDDSKKLAENLGCSYEVLPIEDIFCASLATLEGLFKNKPFNVTEENLQSRIRGILWMAYSNKFNSMLLSCGNKSELAMGYCTLYGDTSGALSPIGDIFKTEVYALCKRIDERSMAERGMALIPRTIIDKPPSAELRPNQTDQDSLPPYELLDEILRLLLCEKCSPEEIVEKGRDRDLVTSIVRTVARSEWKRRQCPPVLKVSKEAFGFGRNMPMARAVYEA